MSLLREIKAIADIADERNRQTEVEGWSHSHDDAHEGGEIGDAAISYIRAAGDVKMRTDHNRCPYQWPWERARWKPKLEARRNLVVAAALIVAEIERLDRAAEKTQ